MKFFKKNKVINENINNNINDKKRSIFKPRMKKPNFILSVIINTFRVLMIIILCMGLALIGVVAGIAKAYVETAQELDLALLDNQAKTSFLYDINGNVLTDYKGIENRVMVNIGSIPKNLQHAFVAVEDARFYSHSGVDVKRIIGALIKNVSSGSNQGGSTITQQLIKNTVLSNELSYKRKIQEAYLAMQLETKYSKNQILESYLNTIYLGENYYGVKVAAKGYFGKELDSLSLRECAMLAGIATNPYYYNPHRNFYVRSSEETNYIAITNNRTNYVLRAMYENQFITQEEYLSALNVESANVVKDKEKEPIYKYAHYVEYAIQEIIDVFIEMRGLENTPENRAAMESDIRTGGYHIKLAIDPDIQNILEDTIENWKDYPGLANPNDSIHRVKNADGTYQEIIQPQVSAVVLDYRTGELKAIVGSRTKPTQLKTLNRAIDMKMPVGSSIKPLSVFAPALELGASPASVAYNMPIPIQGWLDENRVPTWPKNYGGGSYTGVETLREALKRSHNTSTAYTLMNYIGVDRAVDYLLKEGVNRDNIDATPFGVSLGSSGITPVQMTVAFGVLGNGGVYQEPISFLGISDSNGNVIYDSHKNQERRQVFKPSTAWLTIDMLKDAINSGTGTAAKMKNQTVAGKTGTNSEQRGVSFGGLTGWYSSFIWVGHDNYKPLNSKTTGSRAAIPIWKTYMEKIHELKNLPNKPIMDGDAADYGLRRVTTCVVSGQLATEACMHDSMGYGVVTDYWSEQNVPQVECQMHKNMSICTASNALATQFCPQELIQNKGVVILPEGHPLYSLINTQYSQTLIKYLGDFSTSHGLNTNHYCNIHTSAGLYNDPIVQNSLKPDAQHLLSSAQMMLNSSQNTGTIQYTDLYNSVVSMQNLLAQGNIQYEDLAQAMVNLTQAMSNFN